jgi:CheY-like chemotaxis protein
MITTILLVDEDPAARKMVARVLESSGYNAIQASSEREATVKVTALRPQLVIMDLRTPDPVSWEAFEEIGRLQPSAPLIALTAWPHQDQLPRRIDAVLEKPLDLALLLETITNLIASAASQSKTSSPNRYTRDILARPDHKISRAA